MVLSSEQCRAARRLLNLSQSEIAKSAHTGVTTLTSFERGKRTPTHNSLQAIRGALEAAGAELIPGDGGGGPGARLRVAPKGGKPGDTDVSPAQCRAARALLGLSQLDFAGTAGVGRSTVADYERAARTPDPENLAAIRTAFEAAGIEFIPANGGGPGVRLRRKSV